MRMHKLNMPVYWKAKPCSTAHKHQLVCNNLLCISHALCSHMSQPHFVCIAHTTYNAMSTATATTPPFTPELGALPQLVVGVMKQPITSIFCNAMHDSNQLSNNTINSSTIVDNIRWSYMYVC